MKTQETKKKKQDRELSELAATAKQQGVLIHGGRYSGINTFSIRYVCLATAKSLSAGFWLTKNLTNNHAKFMEKLQKHLNFALLVKANGGEVSPELSLISPNPN